MRLLQSRYKYVWLPVLITTMTVVAVVIGLWAFQAVETRQIAMAGDNLALTASVIADNLDEFLDDRLGYLGVAANAPVFRGHDSAEMTEYLNVVRSVRHNSFIWLGATDAAGRIIASTDPAILGQDRKTSTWFQAVRDTGVAHLGDVDTFTEAGGVEAVSFTVPIMDPRGTFLGTVTAQVGIPALEEVLTRTVRSDQAQRNFSGTLEYQFLLRNGYAFVDSDLQHKGNINLKRLGLRSAFLAESGNPGYIEEEHLRRHVPVVTGYARTRGRANVPNLRWGILLRADRSDVLAPTRTVLQNVAIMGAIVWFPMFALLLWATSRLRMEWRQAQDESARARAAETALRESEAFKNRILESSPDCIKVLDLEGRLLFMNKGGQALLEICDVTPFLNSQWTEFWQNTDKEMASAAVKAARAGNVGRFIGFCQMTTGKPKWWEVSITPLFDANGTPDRLLAISRDITERKRVEEVLRDSHERFRKAFSEAPIGMALCATDGRWLQVNRALCQIVGYTEHELLATNFQSITYPDDLQADLALARQLLNGEIPGYQMEKRYIHKLGHVVWIQLTGSLVRDVNGTPLYFIAQVQDITERREAEEALLANEQHMRAILDGALDAVVGMDEQGAITDWNPRAETIFGRLRSDAIGRNLAETIIPPRYREQHHRGMKRFLSTGEGPLLNRRIEMTALRRDGTEFPVELTVSMLKTGGANRFTAFIADITERKRAEEALAASEKRLRTILEAEPECVQVTTEDGVVLEMNTSGLAMFEADSLVQVRGLSILPFIAPDYRDAFATLIRRAYRGTSGTLQYVIIGLKGRRLWLEAHAVPLRDEHNAAIGVLSISRDITERKRAEDALRSSERVLRTLLKEREQLVQDLHDGIIQSLYAIGMSIEECRRLVEEDPEEAKSKLEQEIADVNAVIRAVRSHLAQGENDVPLSASRFKAELTRVAGTMERANALHFRLKVDQRAAECLTAEERRELLYIAQEAMSNCLRHSNASVANVSLRLGRDRVCLEVEDDGTGFDKQALHETNGGLRNIERRAAKVGAKIEIVSYRKHGTRIRLDVPIHTSPGVST